MIAVNIQGFRPIARAVELLKRPFEILRQVLGKARHNILALAHFW
jgi:hypothetical protein